MNKENLDGWAISVELYEWLLENLPTGSTILELGSGTGTIELEGIYNMVSIEHNAEWLNKAESTYIHAPIVTYGDYKWYNKEILTEYLPDVYDLILVDGPPGNIGRIGFLHNIKMFNTNVPIIIDDTNRLAEEILARDTCKTLNKKMEIIGGHEKSFTVLT